MAPMPMFRTWRPPVGDTVMAEVELIAIEGKMLTFGVSCRDSQVLIAEGTHKRAITHLDKFCARLTQRTC